MGWNLGLGARRGAIGFPEVDASWCGLGREGLTRLRMMDEDEDRTSRRRRFIGGERRI